MINNRQGGQNGRRRGRGGQRPQGGGGNGQRDTGNRIDSRARGNAAQLLEKYKSLARDAQMQGDRVNTEYFLQFADHYFRVLSETRSRFEDNRPQRNDGANTFDQDFDGDEEEEQPREFAREQPREFNREPQPRDEYRREEPRREQRPADARQAEGYEPRRDAEPRRDLEPRRDQEPRGERPMRDDRAPRPRREGPVVLEPRAPETAAAPVAPAPSEPAPVDSGEAAPRRRGRPRREVAVPDDAPDAPPAALEADRLPPALGVANDVEERPRRRRTRAASAAPEGDATAA